MLHFHSLKVTDIRQETNDCVSIAFDVPQELKQDFKFTQGQNITVKKVLNDEEVRRSYSICNAPSENQLRVAIKKVDAGLFSTYANEHLKVGDYLEVLPPTGKFNCTLNSTHQKKYIAFAAGSGITPIISIIKTTLETEPNSEYTLVYGNKNRASIIFFEELENLKNKYLTRFNLVHILSRERTESQLNFGRIDEEKLVELNKLIQYKLIDEVFICGPEEMIFCIKDYLEKIGIEKKKIHFELFTTRKKTIKKTIALDNEENDGPHSLVSLKVDGRTLEVKIPFKSNTTILDAALQQGADLPYACKGGMCCTCKAKLIEGEVNMDVHWGLEDEEIEKGYILTCQSHPKSETVIVSFDEK
jgi:ring-1,2-phenylacetyl-CoA epoxidase subunit PaaE